MSSNNKKILLDNIFNDDAFGLLDSTDKISVIKTADQRLVDSFEEINSFIDKNNREPNTSSMSEYGLFARLKSIRENEQQKISLKPYDKHNLLGEVEILKASIDDVLNDDDFGLLETDSDLSIFKYKHVPKQDERAEVDFIAQRQPLKEVEFKPYEAMFQKVHQEIKEGKRKILPFYSIEKNLIPNNFYLAGGVLLYLKSADIEEKYRGRLSGNRVHLDGRTMTVFENGTFSKMLYRSLGKHLLKDGKLITNTEEDIANELYINAGMVKEEDLQTGWIYILKSKSTHSEIAAMKDLYKIGFSSTPVDERIKNAKNEATYLFANVMKVESFVVYNRNADKLEQLLHRFFASACLNIDLYNDQGQRATPREWFVVPLEAIREAIELILSEKILNYKYDAKNEVIVEK
ncbi:MAG: GIY-YIG nuclease family protein [Cytophagia bacterium]|nr:MAG: GIY-YIG nuclease family protein [Cytophagales bacterium]TAG38562.1 MAG: GIY-YIG nuclease family protein [Cytophagia bacterium]TAG80160.1 MAG: GIY-YIG nuclease family protein [Cytophagales bacterium]